MPASCAARANRSPSPGLSFRPPAKTLEKAEELYTQQKSRCARRELFLKSLEQKGSAEEHASAWYGLARIALLQKQPDAAVKLFEKDARRFTRSIYQRLEPGLSRAAFHRVERSRRAL